MAATDDILNRLFALDGKVALITGAAGGIGRVLAGGFAAAGATVALADINAEGVAAVAAELGAQGKKAASFAVDMADQGSVRLLADAVQARFGRVDVLVNGAAINKRQHILEVEEAIFDKIIAVNLRGAYQLCQAVAPGMIKRGGGKIINFSSITPFMALAGVSAYGASKAGVVQMTMSMAVEWAKHNIQVNCIAPGFVLTELTEPLWADEAKAAWMKGRIAMGRPARPEDMLGTAIMLASPASDYITGQTCYVDGGITPGGGHW